MELQGCKRCGKREAIPATQTVKCDLTVMHLCRECWDTFRAWFDKAASIGIAA